MPGGGELLLSLRRNGVWFYPPEADRRRRTKHWKSCAAFIGGRFTVSSGGRAMLLRKHKILLRGSSRCCWREEIWTRCAGKRVDYVPIFWLHSKISSLRRIGVRWPSNVV